MAEETRGSFVGLFDGEFEGQGLLLSVDVGCTRGYFDQAVDMRTAKALPESEIPEDGVYRMTREDLREICEYLANVELTEASFPTLAGNPREVAVALDGAGCGNRWFRLSEAVRRWLRKRSPVLVVDAHVG